MAAAQYPSTAVGDEVEQVAGVTFADPYRWLEEEEPAVRAWQDAQNRTTEDYVKSWPHFESLRRSVRHYCVERVGTLPRFAAGNWFRLQQRTDASPPCVVISREPFGQGRQLLATASGAETTATLSWLSPSPDGSTVAVGVCTDASENNRVVLIDAPSGKLLDGAPPQLLMDAWMGGVCWLPDSAGFYFLGLEGEPKQFKQVVFRHDLNSGLQVRPRLPLPELGAQLYTLITVSGDGRYLCAHHGLHQPYPVAITDLTQADAQWRPFITRSDVMLAGFIHAGRFIGITNLNAPRGRVVAVPLDSKNPNDADEWVEVLSESNLVLRSVRCVCDRYYITGFLDTYSHVLIWDPREQTLGSLQLPARGAIAEPLYPLMNAIPTAHPDEFMFEFSSLTRSWGVYRHRPGMQSAETVRAPAIEIEDAVVQDHWAVSHDGVRIPYHTVRLERTQATTAPALIYAYGGFNIALLPEYPNALAAFIAAGGVFVHGHVRGGAELGLSWWHGGRLQRKQNCFRDLYSIAEDLVAKGITTHGQLAMTGRSNGGMMAGVAATQRPELWRAIVCQVPVTDLIGILRDPYGKQALEREYGDPRDPRDITRIADFSPYHLVRSGGEYPAIFIEAGAVDRRSPPWHARKFAARLQAAVKGSSLVLLRVRANAGHGFATAHEVRLEGYAEWLAFLMRELAMIPAVVR